MPKTKTAPCHDCGWHRTVARLPGAGRQKWLCRGCWDEFMAYRRVNNKRTGDAMPIANFPLRVFGIGWM